MADKLQGKQQVTSPRSVITGQTIQDNSDDYASALDFKTLRPR
jgi:hypothetical protein